MLIKKGLAILQFSLVRQRKMETNGGSVSNLTYMSKSFPPAIMVRVKNNDNLIMLILATLQDGTTQMLKRMKREITFCVSDQIS